MSAADHIGTAIHFSALAIQAKPGITQARARRILMRELKRALIEIGTDVIVERVLRRGK